MITVKLYQTGYCKHPECIISGKLCFNIAKFPMICASLKHPTRGLILFDTGYSSQFFEACNKFPYSLYNIITPVTLDITLKQGLINDDIDPLDVKFIFI